LDTVPSLQMTVSSLALFASSAADDAFDLTSSAELEAFDFAPSAALDAFDFTSFAALDVFDFTSSAAVAAFALVSSAVDAFSTPPCPEQAPRPLAEEKVPSLH
jgi:hypothetical protein